MPKERKPSGEGPPAGALNNACNLESHVVDSRFNKSTDRAIGAKKGETSRERVQAMPASLYVGNLSFDTTEAALQELFESAGKVSRCKVIVDKFTGKSRGFAFVDMDTKEEADKAIKEFDGHEFEGRRLKVNEARPREEGPRRDYDRPYPRGDSAPSGDRRGGYESRGGNRGSGGRDFDDRRRSRFDDDNRRDY